MEKVYTQIEEMLNDIVDCETVNFNGVEIKVKKHLSMEEMLAFTDFVVNICFDSDNGEYRPEVKDYAVRAAMVKLYTNVELPEDTEIAYNVVYKTGVIKTIMQYASKSQFNAIIDAIDDKIAHRVAVNEREFEVKLEELLNSAKTAIAAISETFDGIDNDTVKMIAESLSENKIDMNSLAEKVVKANGEQTAEVIEKLLKDK